MRDSSIASQRSRRGFRLLDTKIILLYHGYNKKTDPSEKRQQREIAGARKIHERWKRQRKGLLRVLVTPDLW